MIDNDIMVLNQINRQKLSRTLCFTSSAVYFCFESGQNQNRTSLLEVVEISSASRQKYLSDVLNSWAIAVDHVILIIPNLILSYTDCTSRPHVAAPGLRPGAKRRTAYHHSHFSLSLSFSFSFSLSLSLSLSRTKLSCHIDNDIMVLNQINRQKLSRTLCFTSSAVYFCFESGQNQNRTSLLEVVEISSASILPFLRSKSTNTSLRCFCRLQNARRANLYYLQQTCPILILSTLTALIR
eukprot:sb/3469139/